MKRCKNCNYENKNRDLECNNCGTKLDSYCTYDILGIILFIISLYPLAGIILLFIVRNERRRRWCAKAIMFSVIAFSILILVALFYILFLSKDNEFLFEDNCSSYGENVIYKEIDGKDYCYDQVTEEVYPYEQKI